MGWKFSPVVKKRNLRIGNQRIQKVHLPLYVDCQLGLLPRTRLKKTLPKEKKNKKLWKYEFAQPRWFLYFLLFCISLSGNGEKGPPDARLHLPSFLMLSGSPRSSPYWHRLWKVTTSYKLLNVKFVLILRQFEDMFSWCLFWKDLCLLWFSCSSALQSWWLEPSWSPSSPPSPPSPPLCPCPLDHRWRRAPRTVGYLGRMRSSFHSVET